MNSGGEAKNIKPMQVWTDLTLPGNAVTRSLSPALDGASRLLSAAPFTGVVRRAKGLIFSAAAPEGQPALAADEGALSLSLLRGDGVWSLLTRHGVPVAALLTWVPRFTSPGVGCSVLAQDLCAAVSIVPGAAPFAKSVLYRGCRAVLRSTLLSDVGLN